MNYYDDDEMMEALNDTLFDMVSRGLIEMGMDESGEFVFWMTDEQKAAYNKAVENGEIPE